MKSLLTLLVTCFLASSWAGNVLEYPVPTDLSMWHKYLPSIGNYVSKNDDILAYGDIQYSPHKTRKLKIKSNINIVAYDISQTIITIFKSDSPLAIVELKGSKHVNVSWINEELIHIQNWPGRCLQLDSIFNVVKREFIYRSGLNHCGV